MVARLHDTPASAMRRFQELGIALEALQKAILGGHAGRISATENDAPFIPGTFAWSYTVRTLRDELIPHGWRKSDPSNFSLVINDKRRINIVVASGDAAVCTKLTPKTRSLKGLYTEAATLINRIETDLFPETLSDELRKVATILEYPTWILLIYITEQEARAELSLPDAIVDGQVISWKERIFIPSSDDGLSESAPDISSDEYGSDIDVPVRRLG